jgi:hypothetical protein
MGLEQQVNTGLDRDRIEALSVAMLEHIRENYRIGPISRDRVYEALNALAFCVATVLQGTDSDEARQFFDKALKIQMKSLKDA